MLKIDIFPLNLTSGTLLEDGCQQILSIMTNVEPLECIKTEIEAITVCHFYSELFKNLNSVRGQNWSSEKISANSADRPRTGGFEPGRSADIFTELRF